MPDSASRPPHSGDGFVELPDGTKRWGRYGAAGILLRHVDIDGLEWFFLAQRSEHVHGGNGLWALPGGAVDRDETAAEAALREFYEEIGVTEVDVVVVGEYVDAHHDLWSYTTVAAEVAVRFAAPSAPGWETSDTAWFTRAQLLTVPKHPGLAAALPSVLPLFPTPTPTSA